MPSAPSTTADCLVLFPFMTISLWKLKSIIPFPGIFRLKKQIINFLTERFEVVAINICYNTTYDFSRIGMAFAVTAIAWSVYALPAVRPVLPPVANADTETVTNVAFTAWEQGLREFRFDLEFTGTASNNVEMAFGTDADGNGELSDGEVAVLAGWDCGELFIANNATDERFTEASSADRRPDKILFENGQTLEIGKNFYSYSGVTNPIPNQLLFNCLITSTTNIPNRCIWSCK